MMMNLFSPFNSVTSKFLSTMWITPMIPLMFISTQKMWIIVPSFSSPFKLIPVYLKKLSSDMMTKSMINSSLMFAALIMLIFYINIMGLFPFIFSSTSHMTFNICLALPLWMSIMMKKLMSPKIFLSHLVPTGTPPILIPFMSIIEMISMLIQPITLSIRLTANMMAGHVLISLMSSSTSISPKSWVMMMPQMTFSTMELFVSFIQAYVMTMLLIMYNK